jgi:guanylate kinase
MASARDEITHVDEFEYVIVNEVIADAIQDLISVVRTYRLGIARQSAKYAALFSALKG